MSKDGIASGFAFGYDPTGRSLFFKNRPFDAEAHNEQNTLIRLSGKPKLLKRTPVGAAFQPRIKTIAAGKPLPQNQYTCSLRITAYLNSMFDVGRSTCPQCLDGGVRRIQPFDLYIDVSTNQMHYAWQAGVRPARNALTAV